MSATETAFRRKELSLESAHSSWGCALNLQELSPSGSPIMASSWWQRFQQQSSTLQLKILVRRKVTPKSENLLPPKPYSHSSLSHRHTHTLTQIPKRRHNQSLRSLHWTPSIPSALPHYYYSSLSVPHSNKNIPSNSPNRYFTKQQLWRQTNPTKPPPQGPDGDKSSMNWKF